MFSEEKYGWLKVEEVGWGEQIGRLDFLLSERVDEKK